jgi:hypothetical protein
MNEAARDLDHSGWEVTCAIDSSTLRKSSSTSRNRSRVNSCRTMACFEMPGMKLDPMGSKAVGRSVRRRRTAGLLQKNRIVLLASFAHRQS